MEWLDDQHPMVQVLVVVAFIVLLSAIVALVGASVSLSVRRRLQHRLDSRRSGPRQKETFRGYAAPLAAAASVLYWRLRETVEVYSTLQRLGGPDLAMDEPEKVKSTQYRMAALFGWMTALRRELLQSDKDDTSTAGMRRAISRVEDAFVQGTDVGSARISGVAGVSRESQSAVSDAMIMEVGGAPRRFDIKGFGAFWEMLATGGVRDTPWFRELAALTRDLDVEDDAQRAVRIKQHWDIYVSVAQLVDALHSAEPERSAVDDRTLQAVRETLVEVSQAVGPPTR